MELKASAAGSMPIDINERVIVHAMDSAKDGYVIAFVPATKPCFYKMWSLITASEKLGVPYFVLNPGQHYDELLGHGMKEFGLEEKVGANLAIRGGLSEKSAEMFAKTKALAAYLKKKWPKVRVVPFVNGDTLTAGILPATWMFATNEKSLQGEAGLRSMAPAAFSGLKGDEGVGELTGMQFCKEWKLLRDEPFPEQWDTYVSAAGCEYFFAPVGLNKEHLVREGYPEGNIFTVGNTVVDAIELKRKDRPEKSVFGEYPALENGEWLRVDIHRRGNLTTRRFRAIVGGVKKMVEAGRQVVFIELTATRKALEHYGLRDGLAKLAKEKENFLFTPLWKEYGHVVEFLGSGHCTAIFTDSGSMQEEMNELGKPCLTARFNTDRPETVMEANSNILVPPLSAEFVERNVSELLEDSALMKRMAGAKKLYGKNAGEKTVKKISELDLGENTFGWAHERLGLWKEQGNGMGYL